MTDDTVFEGFSNIKTLQCCKHTDLNRGLGLRFGDEFTHTGMGRQMVDCEYETIRVNTVTHGCPKNAEDVESWRRNMTHYIVSDIEEIIQELESHRNRLLADLEGTR